MIRNVRQLGFLMNNVRHFNTSVHRLKYTPTENSGVYRRLKVISEDEPDIAKAGIDYNSLEELEQDFLQADHLHDEVVDEMKKISKTQQIQITKRRHFASPKEPGMLTWSEKEQIRHLHLSDPEKWTPTTLAESFPASPTIIKKILKFKWKPTNIERLKAHDHKVSENWKAFHKGQLEVHDLQLKNHLSKFEDRKDGVAIISDEEAAKVTEVILPKPKHTEFISILKGFRNQQMSNKIETQEEKYSINRSEVQETEKYFTDTKQIESTKKPQIQDNYNSNYTLDQFRKTLTSELNNVTDSELYEIKTIIGNKKQEITESAQSSQMYVAPSERFKTNAVVFRPSKKSPLKLVDPDNLPNRIKIPKAEWREGALYKVNDCFYNDKGYFLYKVPGLTS